MNTIYTLGLLVVIGVVATFLLLDWLHAVHTEDDLLARRDRALAALERIQPAQQTEPTPQVRVLPSEGITWLTNDTPVDDEVVYLTGHDDPILVAENFAREVDAEHRDEAPPTEDDQAWLLDDLANPDEPEYDR